MPGEALLPVFGFVYGDTLGVLVLARADEPVSALAAQLMAAAAPRVAPFVRPCLHWDGRVLVADRTLQQCALPPLACVHVRPEGDDDGV